MSSTTLAVVRLAVRNPPATPTRPLVETIQERFVRRPRSILFACSLIAAGSPPAYAARCTADSGPTRATLVELYTSEGCSSCPPADGALRRLVREGPPVVPLALHVDYWDSIGWKDRFAQPSFSSRQAWEVRANGHATSWTPHFFVNGRELDDWHDIGAAARSSAPAAPVRLTLAAEPDAAGRLSIAVDGAFVAASTTPARPLALYVAVTESGVSSRVEAGENRGVTLEHDAVARRWIGPITVAPVGDGEHFRFARTVDLPRPLSGTVGVVAFLQDAASASVLQAVGTGSCHPG